MKHFKLLFALLLTFAMSAQAQIIVTRSGSKASLVSSGSRASLEVKNLRYDASGAYIRFTAPGLQSLQCLVTQLTVSSTLCINRADVIDRLNALFPEIAITKEPLVLTTASTPKHFYGTHYMGAFAHHMGPYDAQIQAMKASGFNVIWFHCDDFTNPGGAPYYEANYDSICAAAARAGGIWVMPGFMNWDATGGTSGTTKAKNFIYRAWNKPAVLRIDGKRVFGTYSYKGHTTSFNQISLDSALLVDYGIHKSDWYLIGNCNYPYQYTRGTIEGLANNLNNVKSWPISAFKSLVPQDPDYSITDMNYAQDLWPWIDGYMMFAGDLSQTAIRNTNLNLAEMVKSRKLPAGYWAGTNGFYASFSFYNYGLAGAALMAQDMVRLPMSLRPIGIMATTANDYNELSYSMIGNSVAAHQFFIPALSASYRIGNTIRSPLLSHEGWDAFIKPYVDAVMTDQDSAFFPTNEIFAMYMLHPKTAAFTSTAPSGFVDLGFTQAYWEGSGAFTGFGTQPAHSGNDVVTGIKAIANVDDIEMGAWIAPNQTVYLKINSTLSSAFVSGPYGRHATFSIPLSGFTGTPVFSIIASDATSVIKTANGGMPITTASWPGQWNKLCIRLSFDWLVLLMLPSFLFKRKKLAA